MPDNNGISTRTYTFQLYTHISTFYKQTHIRTNFTYYIVYTLCSLRLVPAHDSREHSVYACAIRIRIVVVTRVVACYSSCLVRINNNNNNNNNIIQSIQEVHLTYIMTSSNVPDGKPRDSFVAVFAVHKRCIQTGNTNILLLLLYTLQARRTRVYVRSS